MKELIRLRATNLQRVLKLVRKIKKVLAKTKQTIQTNNHGRNILRLFDVLPNFIFTTDHK